MSERVDKLAKVSLILVLILCLLLPLSPGGQAAVVWQDDFDDGNYDGWEADSDVLSADDYSLSLVSQSPMHFVARFYHNSTVASGTWTFDVYLNPVAETGSNGVSISFIYSQTYGGYTLSMDQAGLLLNVGDTSIGIYRPLGGVSGWQNINITRDSEGLFVVYCNGTRAFETVDTQITTSDQFVVNYIGYMGPDISYFALDNITVSDTVDITPPPSLAGYGLIMVIVVIAIVIIVWWMRRESY